MPMIPTTLKDSANPTATRTEVVDILQADGVAVTASPITLDTADELVLKVEFVGTPSQAALDAIAASNGARKVGPILPDHFNMFSQVTSLTFPAYTFPNTNPAAGPTGPTQNIQFQRRDANNGSGGGLLAGARYGNNKVVTTFMDNLGNTETLPLATTGDPVLFPFSIMAFVAGIGVANKFIATPLTWDWVYDAGATLTSTVSQSFDIGSSVGGSFTLYSDTSGLCYWRSRFNVSINGGAALPNIGNNSYEAAVLADPTGI